MTAASPTRVHTEDAHALQGVILSIADADSAGPWLSGDLLRQLADAAPR